MLDAVTCCLYTCVYMHSKFSERYYLVNCDYVRTYAEKHTPSACVFDVFGIETCMHMQIIIHKYVYTS